MSQTLQNANNELPIRAAMRALMVHLFVEALDGLHYYSYPVERLRDVRVEASVRPVMQKETTEQYEVVQSLISAQQQILQQGRHRRH
jgi:hypothetical protein